MGKLTNKEAIERLKCMRLFMQINDKTSESKFLEEDYIANNMAVAALEKQLPTEPIRKSWELPRCPSCGAALGEWLGDGYTKDWEDKKVCDCGQKIKWHDDI